MLDERELQRIADEVAAERDRLAAAGIHVWIIAPLAGVVEIAVEPLTAAAVSYFRERYGDAVRLVEDHAEFVGVSA